MNPYLTIGSFGGILVLIALINIRVRLLWDHVKLTKKDALWLSERIDMVEFQVRSLQQTTTSIEAEQAVNRQEAARKVPVVRPPTTEGVLVPKQKRVYRRRKNV